MYQYKYLKYKLKYLNFKKFNGGIHKQCLFFIDNYLHAINIKTNDITLDYFLSYYEKNKPYYFFYNNKLDLYMNGIKLINNEFNLKENIIVNNNEENIIHLINKSNNNNKYIFDKMICIYKYNSNDKKRFYYEDLYEHDETSIYKS